MQEIFRICDTATIMRSGETSSPARCPISRWLFRLLHDRQTPGEDGHTHETLEHTDERELILDVRKLSIEPKVNDISLKAYRGEIVGIGGLEGQGQPEVIRAILGAVKAEGGTIQYLGKEVHFREPSDGVKAGIGFISGERNVEALFPVRSISENIFAGNAAKNKLFTYLKASTVRKFSQNAVDTYNIKDRQAQGPRELTLAAQPAKSLSRVDCDESDCCCWTTDQRRGGSTRA